MKERPILFSDPMVRAILAGEKMQTRRVVKLREFQRSTTPGYDFTFRCKRALWQDYRAAEFIASQCPYGVVRDRLWVRESGSILRHPYNRGGDDEWETVGFQYADGSVCGYNDSEPAKYIADCSTRSCPSIHMPRWASRITLEITGVRVERLQAISEADAIAEGCDNSDGAATQELSASARGAYALLWDTINAKRAPWESNPWIWVVSFKRIEQSAVRNAA